MGQKNIFSIPSIYIVLTGFASLLQKHIAVARRNDRIIGTAIEQPRTTAEQIQYTVQFCTALNKI